MIPKEVRLEEEDLKICFLKVFFVKLLPEKVCTSSISIFHQVIEALSLESSLFLISLLKNGVIDGRLQRVNTN